MMETFIKSPNTFQMHRNHFHTVRSNELDSELSVSFLQQWNETGTPATCSVGETTVFQPLGG